MSKDQFRYKDKHHMRSSIHVKYIYIYIYGGREGEICAVDNYCLTRQVYSELCIV